MVKIKVDPVARVKLQRGNKVIERDLLDYETNKLVYQKRGFSVISSENKVEKVYKKAVNTLKSKVKKNVKKTKKASKKSME
tara:strand:+ start:296 stop:538 length:243 start_codon:yes stop_codon:yes gene_type:complete